MSVLVIQNDPIVPAGQLSAFLGDHEVLRAWEARLGSAGVENSGIVRGATGALIAFRDPDNIALEFYTLS